MTGFNPIDFSTLTVTVTQLNGLSLSGTAPGFVTASNPVLVDINKDIATFGSVSAATLVATTAIKTSLILDSNSVIAIALPATTSQVNALTITSAATGNSPQISATGSDSNLDLKLAGKGTGKIKFNTLSVTTVDGANRTYLVTDGAGTVSFGGQKWRQASTLFNGTLAVGTYTQFLGNQTYTATQVSTGELVGEVSITPSSSTSVLIIEANVKIAAGAGASFPSTLFLYDTADLTRQIATANTVSNTTGTGNVRLIHHVISGSIAARTYRIYAIGYAINSYNGTTQLFSTAVCSSSITAIEANV